MAHFVSDISANAVRIPLYYPHQLFPFGGTRCSADMAVVTVARMLQLTFRERSSLPEKKKNNREKEKKWKKRTNTAFSMRV
jgi:hypothetical protein